MACIYTKASLEGALGCPSIPLIPTKWQIHCPLILPLLCPWASSVHQNVANAVCHCLWVARIFACHSCQSIAWSSIISAGSSSCFHSFWRSVFPPVTFLSTESRLRRCPFPASSRVRKSLIRVIFLFVLSSCSTYLSSRDSFLCIHPHVEFFNFRSI